MRTLCAALLLAAGPAVACEAERDLMLSQFQSAGLTIVETGTVSQNDDSCRWVDLRVSSGPYLQIPIGEVAWFVSGLDTLLAGKLGPLTLEAQLSDMQLIAVPPNDPGLAYLMTLQQRYNLISGHADIRFDPMLGEFEVAAFRADFPDKSFVDIRGLLTGDPSLAEDSLMGLIEGVTLPRLTVALRNNGYLDSFAFSALSGVLMGLEDPAAVVETAKTQAIVAIGSLPDAVFDKATRGALATFVADGPMVRGEIRVELSGETGLVFAGLPIWATSGDHFSVAALSALLEGTVIRAAYEPWLPVK